MIRDVCSRSIASIVVAVLMSLATTTAIAIVSLANLGEAGAMERTIFSEEITDQVIPDQELPVDALGNLGGLFEARFYEPHSTTYDPRDEIEQASSLYGVDLAMMMSIAKVESDFNPRARTGSYKGLFQLSDYEFKKYGDGSILDARDNARAAAHLFLVQAEKFKWALGHYPDYAERYMVHQQGIQGAIEHYTHPERVAWQSMCATDEGMKKGEQWCRKCVWGNLLPQWKQAFGSVEKVSSGDFVGLWTGRINHLADRFNVAQGSGSTSPIAISHSRRLATLARAHRLPQHRALVASAWRGLPHRSPATISQRVSGRVAPMPVKPGQAVAMAPRIPAAATGRAQRLAASVPR
jgi:hypothetical protein